MGLLLRNRSINTRTLTKPQLSKTSHSPVGHVDDVSAVLPALPQVLDPVPEQDRRPRARHAARVPLRVPVHEVRAQQGLQRDGEHLVVGQLLLGLAPAPRGLPADDHRLVGQRLAGDCAEDDEAVVAAADGAVVAAAADAAAGAVAVCAADLAAGLAVAAGARPVTGDACKEVGLLGLNRL